MNSDGREKNVKFNKDEFNKLENYLLQSAPISNLPQYPSHELRIYQNAIADNLIDLSKKF